MPSNATIIATYPPIDSEVWAANQLPTAIHPFDKFTTTIIATRSAATAIPATNRPVARHRL